MDGSLLENRVIPPSARGQDGCVSGKTGGRPAEGPGHLQVPCMARRADRSIKTLPLYNRRRLEDKTGEAVDL